ncbi:MAG TPA: GDP-mannose 4,6-dehydratase [Thermodesulfovibrio thiophilus]|uniref:GDP-mannose 4,6-dehydratase n=1 Tax=Thermodesulfovibrio thiophilus TaxID=340095 RepID=UPI0017C6CF18|nr:GDP-mannose 4,6-dehydratase [Thermodesulfovibrio thiophilus]HHW20011.1 NAD-dependent epimerase/dehydratase family protein [Thermodesulfovibrio thiophilus]HQA03671.1 GDP-mannose 4,6-dehydratase [Thermodesulfovibrio thiophilus]
MQKILVTGSAGFIGWATCRLLLNKGATVIGIDNLNDYYDPKIKELRLADLKTFQNFIFYKIDIECFEILKNIFQLHKIESVINLAARAGVRASVENPWGYLDTNVKGTINLLECVKNYGVKTFIHASTSSVYGDTDQMPFKVSDNTDKPLAPYPASKKSAELFCYSYHYLYGVNTIIPRYFTVYGPFGRPDMSIFRFIKKIDYGEPITVYGDGKQKRDFTFVEDIAEATVSSLNLEGYKIFNLGNDNPVELIYVINLIEKLLGKKAQIQWQPRHPADIYATWADIQEAKNFIGWSPKVSIEEGIEKTVHWFRENRELLKNIKI